MEEFFTPEQIIAALEEEKLHLEELLETDELERQTIQERIIEINDYFAVCYTA